MSNDYSTDSCARLVKQRLIMSIQMTMKKTILQRYSTGADKNETPEDRNFRQGINGSLTCTDCTEDGDSIGSLIESRKQDQQNNYFIQQQHIGDSNDDTSYCFHWMESFDTDIKQTVGKTNFHDLCHLLDTYLGNITKYVNVSKTCVATKLRDHSRKVLMFFHLSYQNIKVIADHSCYLDKMSEIIEFNINMELRASKVPSAEASLQISAKLLATLYIYLDNSEEHILRVLLRMKMVNKYGKIYRSILRKCCTNIRPAESISNVTYVRYLLVLKLWKKACESLEERKRIDELALKILGSQMPINRGIDTTKFLSFISKNSETLRSMKQNSFDERTACQDFILFEKRINSMDLMNEDGYECSNGESSLLSDSMEAEDRVKMMAPFENDKKHVKSGKNERGRKLKPGEIILIDLTGNNSEKAVNKVLSEEETMLRRKRIKKRLTWLEKINTGDSMKNNSKVKLMIKNKSSVNRVEIADAHSTNHYETCQQEQVVVDTSEGTTESQNYCVDSTVIMESGLENLTI